MRSTRAMALFSFAAAAAIAQTAHATSPVTITSESGFSGLEEPKVIYFPDTDTFQNDPTNFQNHVDEGGGLFRDTLRNDYASAGWWDGDGADATRTDRQRSEPRGISALGNQPVEQTYEYSFDFRTDPTFKATSDFCHIFQLKAINGNDSLPLTTISLLKNGSGIQGQAQYFTDGNTPNSNGTSSQFVATSFSYTAGQWIHFDIRITPCALGESTGSILLSINGGAFTGVTNKAIDLTNSTTFRPKFGFYRKISTTNDVPAGDSWVEHRTITGFIGSSNSLTWAGDGSANTWDTATTANFLNGANASAFNTMDEVNFTGAANTAINLSGNLWPDYVRVNSSSNYTFQGTGSLTGGTLRKDGTGTLTIANANSYPGLTDIRAGTVFVTGSIGNNSAVSLTGGTLKIGSANALGTGTVNGTDIAGGMLDLNGFSIGVEPITIQGTGVSGAGAIINSGANQTNTVSNVTLTGNTTFGGSGNWDISGAGAKLSTGSSAFNLTKTGTNQISLAGLTVDSALANITISQGILSFQTSTTSMGDPAKTLAVNSGAILNLSSAVNTLTKQITLNNSTIWAAAGSASQNNLAGNITINSGGGILDAGSALTGGTPDPTANLNIASQITAAGPITKNGPGTVTLSNAANSLAGLTINAGTLNLSAPTKVTALTLAGSIDNWTAAANVSTLAVETTAATKATLLTALQNQLAYGTTHPAGINSVSTLPANEALALIDNAATGFGTYANLSLDSNTLLITPLLLGDANADGAVDSTDLQTLLQNFGSSSPFWTDGNFNNAATVDLNDLADVLNNLGLSLSNPNAFDTTAPTPTPEPATLALLLPALLHRRRQTR